MDNFKENLQEGLKKVKNIITVTIKKSLKKIIWIVLAIAIVIVSLVASYDALVDQFSKKTGKHMKNNPIQYDAKDGSIIIEEEQLAILEKMIEDMGVTKEKLGLTTDNLKKIYAAEVVTQEINRQIPEEEGKYYGRIYVKRAKDSTEEKDLEDLTYIDYEQFKSLSASEIIKYFSIHDEKLCIASTRVTKGADGTTTEQVNIQELAYKNQLLPYMMPVEFLLDLCLITHNPEFVIALADKVIDETKITIAVLQEETTTQTETTNKYKIETEILGYEAQYDKDGKYIGTVHYDPDNKVGKEQTEIKTETITTVSPIVKIVSIKSWFIEQTYTYNKVITTTVTGGEEEEIDLPDEQKPLHNYQYSHTNEHLNGESEKVYESTITRKVEQRQYVTITTTQGTYQEGITKEPLDKADEFLKLLKTPFKMPESFREEAAIGDVVSGAGILLQMLQNSERTQAVEHIMRYILYIYTGKYYGVKELNLNLFEANNFTTITNNSLSSYLFQFSHSSEAPQSADGKYYLMYGDGVGWPTIGNADLQWKSHYSKFDVPGKVLKNGEEQSVTSVKEYVNGYLTRGATAKYTNDEVYQMQIYIEKELVDKIGDSVQEVYYNSVVNSTQGLNLSRQQLYALTHIVYNFGHLPVRKGKTFKQVYEEGAALYTINSWEHNRYIWDNWWNYLEGGAPGHIKSRDATFETYVKGILDYSQSSAGPLGARTHYIYYTQAQINRISYAPNLPITRSSSNEKEIFTYEENSSGTNGIIDVGNLELTTYTNKAGKTFIEYKQNVGPWATMPYGNNTISYQGCSITCLAIMTSGYGYNFTPQKWSGTSLIGMASQAKQYAPGSTHVQIGGGAYNANLNVAQTNKTDIQNHLKTGDVVIIHVLGAKNGYNSPYTSSEHWMVLLDINDSGDQVYVCNPYSGKSNGWTDINQALKSLSFYIKVSK